MSVPSAKEPASASKDGALMVNFQVPGKPVGVNSAYKRGALGRGKGFYLSSEARAFKERLRAYALCAVRQQGWKMPTPAQKVAVAIILWNCPRFDVDSPTKFILDSMQGVVYGNDKCVDMVGNGRGSDPGSPRVEVTVSLLVPGALVYRSMAATDACVSAVTPRRPEVEAAPS